MKHISLHNEHIFTIPVGDFFDNDINSCSLVFSPLANNFFLALPHEVAILEDLAQQHETNKVLDTLKNYTPIAERPFFREEYSYNSAATMYLLLNEKCNFKCTYCYSAAGRSNKELSINAIYTALAHFLSDKRNAPINRAIMFMGGGEPTLSWDLIEQATLYAEKIAKENNIVLSKGLSTNGSILTEQTLEFYKEHNFEIQFSFDVIPEIQNAQRGQFGIVATNLKLLGENGVKCRIRSTITELNVDRMSEMVEFCHHEFPNVNFLTCEHVVDPEYFKTPEIVESFYNRYFTSFIKAHSLGKKYNINVFSSSTGTVRAVREKFCFNLYCLTPYATFTTCPNISSPLEEGYKDAVFGHIGDNQIEFDQKKYKSITSGDIHSYPKCEQCWAKWNCGGGCPNQRKVYSSEIFDQICVYLRNILRYNLIIELSEKYKKSTEKDLFVEITNILKKQEG